MIKNKIWYEFLNFKFGDEYLILYINKQRRIRKYFKIATILLSCSGIWSVYNELKYPAIIAFIIITLVQIFTSIESYLIHSEKDIDDLCELRNKYYSHWNELENLWHKSLNYSESDLTDKFYELREQTKKIEELDNKLGIKKNKILTKKADKLTRTYLKIYNNE